MMQLDLRTVPYNNFGVMLWSVEDRNGFTYFYCSPKAAVEQKIKTAQNDIQQFIRIRNEYFFSDILIRKGK